MLNGDFYQFDFKSKLGKTWGMSSQRKTKKTLIQLLGIVALFSIFGSVGCNAISTQGTASSCESGTAQISVYEGSMQRVCGCTEGAGIFTQPGSLTCTVSINTTVYFYFVNITNTHQIAVNTIGTTQPISSSSSVKVAALVMNQSGTFNFQDLFNGIGGSFVVNP